ncbi:mannitol dehydrogenase family protein [uncultured Hoeflea sp.]|uniref:mannitol dehydrogenase family protein n=1 Tax=uncultured Hoeflea sp. TaxID=538666 RepID=UPI0030DBFB8B|tara:strand:- start:2280 stop:3716 length:1437 start_codon:yes stop_codon:yes gene_type:complete
MAASAHSLLSTSNSDVTFPNYDRSTLTAGIVHIGVGNFNRAHMAHYLDRLFEKGLGHDWAIVGSSLMPADTTLRDALSAQDWCTTVVDLSRDDAQARVVGSMIDFLDINPQALIAQLASPAIRIVSLTITEGGYFVDSTGAVMFDHPDIQADIRTPQGPVTVFGVLIEALRRRKAAGVAPFTVLSCDNIQANGDVSKRVVTALAEKQDNALAAWIETYVAFPNSMVDCITPRTTDKERALVSSRFGITDAAPVVCEPFRQWVIEDHFPCGRPPLEEVGVTFVEDVSIHETMKLRLLNASHASLCYAAALMGYTYVHEALEDVTLARWLAELPRRETIPCLTPLEGVDYASYLDRCIERFKNPAISDTIARLARDGSDRQPKFILPTVRTRLTQGLPVKGFALELALWQRFCAHPTIALDDPLAKSLEVAAKQGAEAFLDITAVFDTLGQDDCLRTAMVKASRQIDHLGVRGAINAYLG